MPTFWLVGQFKVKWFQHRGETRQGRDLPCSICLNLSKAIDSSTYDFSFIPVEKTWSSGPDQSSVAPPSERFVCYKHGLRCAPSAFYREYNIGRLTNNNMRCVITNTLSSLSFEISIRN